MTSACGVVTEIRADEKGFNEGKVNKAVRSALNGQNAVTVEFPIGTDGITIKFVEKVEKELTMEGKHTYLFTPENEEDATDVVQHLNEAGIIVLLAIDGPITCKHFKEDKSFFGYNEWKSDMGPTVEDAVKFIKEISAFSVVSKDGDYI